MPSRVKQARKRARQSEVEAFFAGVDEARALLDRLGHAPERRRERLAGLAKELLRPRPAAELAAWFVEALAELLAARGVELIAAGAELATWAVHGSVVARPKPAQLAALLPRSGPLPEQPVELPGGVFVAVIGQVGPVAGLWIEGAPELEPATRAVLQALADAAAVALEG